NREPDGRAQDDEKHCHGVVARVEGEDAERVSVRAIQTTRRQVNVNNSSLLSQPAAFGLGPALYGGEGLLVAPQYSPPRARSFRRGSPAPTPVLDRPLHRHGRGHICAARQEVDPEGRRGVPLDRSCDGLRSRRHERYKSERSRAHLVGGLARRPDRKHAYRADVRARRSLNRRVAAGLAIAGAAALTRMLDAAIWFRDVMLPRQARRLANAAVAGRVGSRARLESLRDASAHLQFAARSWYAAAGEPAINGL